MRASRRHRVMRMRMALLASVGLISASSAAIAGSVSDTIRAALETNPELGIVRADRRAIDQELRQARARYLPSVDVFADTGPEIVNDNSTRRRGPGSTNTAENWRSGVGARLSQMLFDGFETRSEVERQTARIDSASYRVAEAAEFIAVDAVEAHLEVLRNAEIVAFNETNVEAHQRILGQVRELERTGAGGIADVRQAEARLANAQATLVQAINTLRDAEAFYERVVGMPALDLTLEPPPAAVLPSSVEDAARTASVQSPTVLLAAADVDVAAAELRGSRSGFYPRLDLELTARTDEDIDGADGRATTANALVVARYNLFRGGADIAREREAFHRLNEARSALLRARRGSEEAARVSMNAYEITRLRTERLRERAEAQRRTRDAYAQQFEIGQRDLLDLLDSENELFIARVQLLTSEYTERFAIYRVLGVTGELLGALDIAAPRETISIHRTPATIQSAPAVEEKTQQLFDIRAEPRPLRGVEAGEPPADALDASDAINREAIEPPPPAPAPLMSPRASAAPQPATTANVDGAASYDSLGSFWKAMTGRGAAPAAASPSPRPAAPVEPAAPAPQRAEGGPSYESFGSFWTALTGGASKVD
jgi:adhesin transport system outer membrane protein